MLSIGEFSKISQTTPSTLRYYDELGLVRPAHVNQETGYRYYNVEQLRTILLINKLKLYSCTLDEIRRILPLPHPEAQLLPLLKEKQAVQKQEMRALKQVETRLTVDINNLERGLSIMADLDSIKVQLLEIKPMTILSLGRTIPIDDFGTLLGDVMSLIAEKGLTPVGSPITIYHQAEFNPESMDMEIGLPVDKPAEGTRTLEGGTCASATLEGPYSQLTEVYSALIAWVQKESFTITDAPYEIYHTDPTVTPAEKNITQVLFPVTKQDKAQ